MKHTKCLFLQIGLLLICAPPVSSLGQQTSRQSVHPEMNWDQLGRHACTLAQQVMQVKLHQYDLFRLATLEGTPEQRQSAILAYAGVMGAVASATAQGVSASVELHRNLEATRQAARQALLQARSAEAASAAFQAQLSRTIQLLSDTGAAAEQFRATYSAARIRTYATNTTALLDAVLAALRQADAHSRIGGRALDTTRSFPIREISGMTAEARELLTALAGEFINQDQAADFALAFRKYRSQIIANAASFVEVGEGGYSSWSAAAVQTEWNKVRRAVERLNQMLTSSPAEVQRLRASVVTAQAGAEGARVTAAEASAAASRAAEGAASASRGRLTRIAARTGEILSSVGARISSTRVGGAVVRGGTYVAGTTVGRLVSRILLGPETLVATVAYEAGTFLDNRLLNSNTIYNERDVSGQLTWTAQNLVRFTPQRVPLLFESLPIDQICRLVRVSPVSDAQSYRGVAWVRERVTGSNVPAGTRLPLAENVVRFSEDFLRNLPSMRNAMIGTQLFSD